MSAWVDIAVVEDSVRFRKTLVKTLQNQKHWRIVAQCGSAADALLEIPKSSARLVLLDIGLPDVASGVDLIKPLRGARADLEFIILTVAEDPVQLGKAIQAGASGYIIKRESGKLIDQIEDFLAGRSPGMSPSVASYLWKSYKKRQEGLEKAGELSPRELEILQLTMRGRHLREIGSELNISVNTVKTHLRHVYTKLGVSSPIEAAVKLLGGRGILDDIS